MFEEHCEQCLWRLYCIFGREQFAQDMDGSEGCGAERGGSSGFAREAALDVVWWGAVVDWDGVPGKLDGESVVGKAFLDRGLDVSVAGEGIAPGSGNSGLLLAESGKLLLEGLALSF